MVSPSENSSYISRKEQKRRFLERLENPEKNWKFSVGDLSERAYWDDYKDAYEKMIRNTASEHAPWVVVPADNKWFSGCWWWRQSWTLCPAWIWGTQK